MKYFIITLVICFELLSQNGFSQNLNGQRQLFDKKIYKLYTEAYEQHVNLFEDSFQNNTDCSCTNGECVNEDGKQVCKCKPGFGNFTKFSCRACNCGPDSNCTWIPKGIFNIRKVCICKSGYLAENSKCGDCRCINGECVIEGRKQVCKCKPGFGNFTEFSCRACDCGPDSNCIWLPKGIFSKEKVCICKLGYHEENSTCVGPCTKNPCKNGGICKDVENGYECLCPSKYTGENCNYKVTPCTSNPCQNGGNCIVNGESFLCNCIEPYGGRTCDLSPCSSNPCLNGGTCSEDGENYKCACESPFKGEICEIGPCSSNPCLNGGTCSEDGENYKCACESPFKGELCEIGPCSSNPCQNNGTCKVNSRGFECICKPPYKGNLCRDGPCSSNPCQNSGVCQVDGLKYKCQCKQIFSGLNCETGPCSSNPCLNKGKCKVVGMDFKCDCPPPYEGKQCEKDPCSNSPCRNGGTCTIKGNSFSCYCPENHVGNRCQHFCDCKNGKCRITSDGEVLCECLPEYGKKSDVCEACNCGTGSNCTWEGGFLDIEKKKYCLCPDGSKLKEQHCEDPCNSSPCLNDGKCDVVGKNFKCLCKPPYTGSTCKYDLCTKDPCLNGGFCKINGTSFQCYCKTPYSGKLCEKVAETSSSATTADSSNLMSTTQDICNDDVCVHGKCEIIGQYYKCRCYEGYTGLQCEDRIEIKSDKQAFWQIIQTSIMFSVLVLLSGVFCLLLRRKR